MTAKQVSLPHVATICGQRIKDNENLKPPIITRLQELPEDVAPEVNWYLQDAGLPQTALFPNPSPLPCSLVLQEGMGRQFIWHGLARWHAYAAAERQ